MGSIGLPWIEKEDCIGCGVCVEACPVHAIYLINEKAEIRLNECIRCGICHNVCPQDAVKHDSEKIPQEVEENIDWTLELLKHYKTKKDKEGLVKRIEKHFTKERKVAEITLERLKTLKI